MTDDLVKSQDAGTRAKRTFLQGFMVTIVMVACSAILTISGTVEWTKEYWLTFGGMLLVNVLTAVASYVMRYLDPPA